MVKRGKKIKWGEREIGDWRIVKRKWGVEKKNMEGIGDGNEIKIKSEEMDRVKGERECREK